MPEIESGNALFGLLSVLVLVFANGFFVAAEFALVTIRRTRVEELVAQGSKAARSVERAISQLDRYIAGTQVGITLASLALGWIGEPALAKLIAPLVSALAGRYEPVLIHSIAVGVAFTFITFMHVILGELIPKSLALQSPEKTALLVARPMEFVVVLLQPLIWSLNGIGNALLNAMGLRATSHGEGVHSMTELSALVRQSHEGGQIDDLERRMLQRTFRFSDMTASSIMVPRSKVSALDLAMPTPQLLARAAKLGRTRLPACEGSLDQVVGILYLQDLFRASMHGPIPDIRKLMRPVMLVPETIHLDDLIDRFRAQRMQLAVVVDEYGGTAGVVTVEDIAEVVFGDLQDQLESERPQITKTPDGDFIVRGDSPLAEVQEATGWRLDDAYSDTVAGFVMSCLGRIPRVGDTLTTPDGMMRVTGMEHHSITEVRLEAASQRSAETRLSISDANAMRV